MSAAEVDPAPTTPRPVTSIAWGGIDFDTTALDRDLIEALSRLAPEGGRLRALSVSAKIKDVIEALQADVPDPEVCLGVWPLIYALTSLAEAEKHLLAADKLLVNARRRMGLVA